MREHKSRVLGSMGCGTSTLVRTSATGAVIDTDVHNSDRQGADKASSTVAMDYADYADVDLANGDHLRLYSTPGQQRFDLLWPILLQHAAQVPAVIGVSRLDRDRNTSSLALARKVQDVEADLAP